MPSEKKVKFVSLELKAHALVWWNQEAKRIRKGKEIIRSWSRMKEKLKEKFLQSDYYQTLFQKFHKQRQYNKSVDEYTEEVHMLQARNDL